MIVVHKEVKFNGTWEHSSVLTFEDDSLWDIIATEGDIFGRRYTALSELDIQFHQPASPIRHWNKTALLNLSQKMGERVFSKTFGYWPWDSIEMFTDKEDVNGLMTDYGISDIRMVGWID